MEARICKSHLANPSTHSMIEAEYSYRSQPAGMSKSEPPSRIPHHWWRRLHKKDLANKSCIAVHDWLLQMRPATQTARSRRVGYVVVSLHNGLCMRLNRVHISGSRHSLRGSSKWNVLELQDPHSQVTRLLHLTKCRVVAPKSEYKSDRHHSRYDPMSVGRISSHTGKVREVIDVNA